MTTPDAALTRHDEPALRASRGRGLESRQRLLLAKGGTLSVQQVALRFGPTRQAVDKPRRAGRMIAVNTGRRGFAYPAWQFESERVLAGIEAVLTDLAVRDGWMQTAFFMSGDPRLEGATPLDELRGGNVKAVRRAARGYGEYSAG